MQPRCFYNEIDPYAAQWLRNLIAAGHIAPGVVDERSIVDIDPADLAGFTQCHFFAGIGVWSYALRLAGWADDRPLWTGSCPCQPFSAAGKGAGHEDERHLWPAWQRLISQCRPPVVFGEQVAGADGLAWLDVVLSDLENDSYAVAAVDLPAAGVGAPHIRQRLFFVGDARSRGARTLAHNGSAGLEGRNRRTLGLERTALERGGSAGALADADFKQSGGAGRPGSAQAERVQRGADIDGRCASGPTNGFWADADWIACRDGKARPVEPGTFPLAHGTPARVGRLRAYGNALVAQAAAAVIGAYMEVAP